ncbi:MAG TPA: TPM domain-containing protein [Thermoanaerobaculia bacterium]|nr:TPM domain-containing protein [Thermoanaerobaculia bacterium]
MQRDTLSRDEIDRIEAKIAAAEQLTSAELRVVVTRSTWLGIKTKARSIFQKYQLDKTTERNAVLLLIDFRDHEVLVYGDEGVNSRVGQEFWNEVRDAMVEEFRAGKLADGLSLGIRMVGEKLSQLYPPKASDVDEISNALIFD